MLLDATLRVVLANAAAAMLFRVPANKLYGLPIADVVPNANLGRLLADGRRSTLIETSLHVPTAHRAVATVRIATVRMTVRKTEYHLLTFEDVSARVRFERFLVESESQAAMGLLAAGILREVANPIVEVASELVFLRSILDTLDSDELKQALDVSLGRMDGVRRLLAAVPRMPGAATPRYEIADVHDVIRRCVGLIEPDAERKGIHVEIALAPCVAACEMDLRLMQQALLSLLQNAIEAMPDGGHLEVRTRRRDGGDLPPVVLIQVADTGVGIDDGDLRHVFRPLFSTKSRAAGLGLSFSRQTVEQHGGQLRLASRGRNHGSVATVSLPLRQASPVPGEA